MVQIIVLVLFYFRVCCNDSWEGIVLLGVFWMFLGLGTALGVFMVDMVLKDLKKPAKKPVKKSLK